MGTRGPLAAKGLKRRKSRQAALDAATTVGQIEVDVEAPFEPPETWHTTAIQLYESAQRSGQAEFYTETDWVKLYMLCEQLTLNLQPTFVGFAKQAEVLTVNGKDEVHYVQKPISGFVPMNGATLNAIQAMMASLGISEGDRRRVGIELIRTPKSAATNEAEQQARADAALVEAMKTGNVVEGHFGQASGE